MMTVLHGHTSPETAYVVDDYPYGYRLRCKIRYWIETKNGYGQRMVSQTTNPKIAGREVWNKPKAGVYSDLCFLYTDANGHVHRGGCHKYSPSQAHAIFAEVGDQFDADQVARFKTLFPEGVA